MKKYIKGTYKRSIFKSNNGYIIGLFRVKETDDDNLKDYINKMITFTGYFPELNEDDNYVFYGEAVNHPRYGFQYQVTESQIVKPEDIDGLVAFLSSDLFKGVGEKMAIKIVEVLGKEALDKIIVDPSCLMLVPKLSQKKIDHIYNTLIKYEESHKMVVYLTDLGFSMKDALLIYNTYRNNTISYIEHNIYDIADDIKEISFVKIDKMALKMGVNIDDERRLKATTYFVMKYLTSSMGHTYLTSDVISNYLYRYLHFYIDEEKTIDFLKELGDENKIVTIDNNYYLLEIYEAEEYIINKMRILSRLPKDNYNFKKALLDLEKNNQISYNDCQKEAIMSALTNNITIITGGPGTGKTTIIKAITELYQKENNLNYLDFAASIALLAPTGRASKRMAEISVAPATTIHRFLKWNKDNGEFAINEENKSNKKLVVVDEMSMVDTLLFSALLKGLNDNVRLVLVGDYYQLPSVGAGQILKDLVESSKINVIKLKQLYRQKQDSYINALAQKIKNNELDDTILGTYNDYQFIETDSYNIKEEIKNICYKLLQDNLTIKDIQVMAPIYRGENGIDSLNVALQTVFNPASPSKSEYKYGDVILREGDKMLLLVNLPDENVFNGDIGYIEKIEKSNNKLELYINFDGNIIKFSSKDLINVKHGYTISIHKSQGSEFPIVIIPFTLSYYSMLYNKIIYTAVTRAKKKLYLVGSKEAFIKGVNTQKDDLRNSKFKDKLMYNL
ncbi:MAG: ATP-dependent RecD-like DNA helicase [Bacilli bacterium]|nr:ATP-dependent RecD-like DNA helicase [Bacilli bacterium]